MKAVVYEKYGPPEVLEFKDVRKPSPRRNEILIRVRAATVSAGDSRMRRADPFLVRLVAGLFRPRRIPILGFELAGDVEAVGDDVKRFRPGDAVFAFTGFRFGAHAEYRCVQQSGKLKRGLAAPKPTNMTYEEAAAVPVGGLTALGFLRKGQIEKRRSVLIYGASGSVGTYAVQLARHFGADVTGVCSTANVELVRSLGAQRVIDYTAEDFTKSQDRYDFTFDAVGKLAASGGRGSLAEDGVFLSVRSSMTYPLEDLILLKELIEAGEIRAVIDRRYPLSEIVEAHRYVDAGHKKGNVVISMPG